MVALFSILTIVWGIFIGSVFTMRVAFLPMCTIIVGIVTLIGAFFRKRTVNIVTTSLMLLAYILTQGYFFIDEFASDISLSNPYALFLCLAFILPAFFLLGALLFAVKGKKKKGEKNKKMKNEDNSCPNCGTKAEKGIQFCGSCGTACANSVDKN